MTATIRNARFCCSLNGSIVRQYVNAAVAQLVEALRAERGGRAFESRWFHWNFFY